MEKTTVYAAGAKLMAAGAKLVAAGNKLCAEGYKLCAEGSRLWDKDDQLWAAGYEFRTEGLRLMAEGAKLINEGTKIWEEGRALYLASESGQGQNNVAIGFRAPLEFTSGTPIPAAEDVLRAHILALVKSRLLTFSGLHEAVEACVGPAADVTYFRNLLAKMQDAGEIQQVHTGLTYGDLVWRLAP